MLPPITTTSDNPATTGDDSANLPPSSIHPCVGITLDVRGPGFLTGDITWSVLNSSNVTVSSGITIVGQNTIEATISFDDSLPPGNYTIKAVETGTPANVSTHAIQLLPLPSITIGTPNQPHIGGHTQFTTTFPYPLTWEPAQVNSSGLATWTTAGTKVVKYKPVGGDCEVSLNYVVYPNLAIAEYDGINCVYLNSGQSLQLTVTGGSGSYGFSITGQNSVNSTGLIEAGMYAGEYTLTVVDNTAGLVTTIPVCIGSQTQFCVGVEASSCTENLADPCCEISVDCGETLTLKVPTFHLRVNGVEQEIKYTNYGIGTTGESGYLRSGSAITDAVGNPINCTDSETLFEIVTSLDMSDIVNAPFGIGFSKQNSGSGVNSIDNSIVWFTSSGVRYVEMRKEGVAQVGSRFPVIHGDVVSAGYRNGKFVLYINNLLQYEDSNIDCCGTQYLDVSIEQPNKAIGGNLTGLTWTIVTPGLPEDVGSVNSSGVYTSPTNSTVGLVQAEASVGNAKFRVNIRNIKPSIRYTKPQAFLAGRAVEIWIGKYVSGFNEPIRLAKDGSPDAIQNPGMINLGTLEGSATFQEALEYQDFDDDLGTYLTTISKESATLTATFLEVRDLHKMKTLMPHSTYHSKRNGNTEISVGGRQCGVGELRVIMVIGQSECDGGYDVLYIPRVQNKGNLTLELGRKTNGKYEINLTALPDYTRPSGKQLYSIFQIDNCSSPSCDN